MGWQAYVGGLYKDSQENVEVIKKWLFPILCPYIKVAYQHQHRRYLQDPGRGISAQPTAARDTESLPLATSRSACYSSRAEDRSSSTARDHASPVLDEKKTLCSVVKSKAGPRRPRSSPKPPSPAGSNSTSGRYRRSKKSAAPEYPPTRPARSFTSVSSGDLDTGDARGLPILNLMHFHTCNMIPTNAIDTGDQQAARLLSIV
ncbi:hypothetical protein BC834DRAFT_421269 [Gloeopeniophorella convolvens]|nr:hypothetical protein BC834DRAFT_421269 [Gloeopeniophorella convolvens]